MIFAMVDGMSSLNCVSALVVANCRMPTGGDEWYSGVEMSIGVFLNV